MTHRYEPILVPGESWMVFDIHLGVPAEMDGRSLIGLAPEECGRLARRMNREHRAAGSAPGPKEAMSWRS